jgi:uridylate kinase
MDRANARLHGMLATVINAMALQDALEKTGVFTRVQSAIEWSRSPRPTSAPAVRHLEKGRWSSSPRVRESVLHNRHRCLVRAMEIGPSHLQGHQGGRGLRLGPEEEQGPRRYRTLTYNDVLRQNLHVMDSTAISLCMDNKLPSSLST